MLREFDACIVRSQPKITAVPTPAATTAATTAPAAPTAAPTTIAVATTTTVTSPPTRLLQAARRYRGDPCEYSGCRNDPRRLPRLPGLPPRPARAAPTTVTATGPIANGELKDPTCKSLARLS